MENLSVMALAYATCSDLTWGLGIHFFSQAASCRPLIRKGDEIMFSSRGKKNRPEGFTLVELLVVMAIIGVLMGLVLPAIMAIRQTAWRAVCTNNEKDIATAILAYHNSKQSLPYWSRARNGVNYSWCAQILEQIGEGKLGQAFEDGALNDNTVVPLSVFKCRGGDAKPQGLSYVVNCGTGGVAGTNRPTVAVMGSGLFFKYDTDTTKNYKSSLSVAGSKDGMSNTILLTESLSKHNKLTVNWHDSGNDVKKVGIIWELGKANETNPNNYGKNDSKFFDSNHSNTDQVALADGSVKSVNKRINYNTYACLMAPDDTSCGLTWKFDASYE